MGFNWSNINNPMDVVVGLHYEANQMMGIVFVILIFSVMYYRFRNEPTKEAVAGASFVSVIAAVLMRLICSQGICLVNDYYLGGAITIMVASVAWLAVSR